uniref:Diaphanous-related formin 3 n=1 Tax=Esox lucius TaxID=8010 RepID=A0A6Q2XTK1_ESOLU
GCLHSPTQGSQEEDKLGRNVCQVDADEDMNLNEDKKAPLREKDLNTKREMVIQYIITASKTGSLRSSHQIAPQEFLGELKSGVTDERLMACLDSLRVSLTSNPVSWVQSFGHEGLGLLLDTLEKLLHKKHQDKLDRKSQHKVIQCLKAFMNNKYGLERILGEEKSLTLLARAIDPTQPSMMTDVVKLLSAICIVGEENTLEKVLEAITTAGERRAIERFSPIVEGLRDRSVQLQVACMQLINALTTSPDELDCRLHVRNEFMRSGLREILPVRRRTELIFKLFTKVFEEHKEEDMLEFSHRLEDIKSEMEYPCFTSMVKDSGAETYFLSILQHLMLIRNDYFVRSQYFKIIDECVSQIVLHRSGTDPDFTYRKRLDVDFTHLLEVCVDKARVEECEQRTAELALKFDEEYLGRQEAQAQLLSCEEKINELQAELLAFRSQVTHSIPLPYSLPTPPLPYSLPTPPLPYSLPTPPLPYSLPTPPLPYSLPTPPLPYSLPTPPLPYSLPTPPLPYSLPTPPLPYSLPTPPLPYSLPTPPLPYSLPTPPLPYSLPTPPLPYSLPTPPLPYSLPTPPLPYSLPTPPLPYSLPTPPLPYSLPTPPLPYSLPTPPLPYSLPTPPLPYSLPTPPLPYSLPTPPLPYSLPTPPPPLFSPNSTPPLILSQPPPPPLFSSLHHLCSFFLYLNPLPPSLSPSFIPSPFSLPHSLFPPSLVTLPTPPLISSSSLSLLPPPLYSSLSALFISIFLGSFRMPYEEIRRAILEVDDEQLTDPMIQNLVKHLPEQEQLNALLKYKNDYNSLSEPEQFGVVMSSVKRLRPRLNSILFKLQFEEQVNNLRPDIMAVNAACEEVRKSKAFSQLLELVLLMGNYMNAGSRNAQSFGFDLSSLCKLKDTKSADQKTTLLHFLASLCEEDFPEVIKFSDDLQHVERASRVSAEALEKNLAQMERQLVQLERDLDTFSSPDDPDDLFTMFRSLTLDPHSFARLAREQYHKLRIMHGNMGTLYQNMVEYFAIDPKKTSVEELFTDLSNFRTMFVQALKENGRRREAEEKLRRARVAREKAEREKQERQQKRRLVEVNAENSDETGVMDSLLEALQSGAAFRDRRKRAPRPRGELYNNYSTLTITKVPLQ